MHPRNVLLTLPLVFQIVKVEPVAYRFRNLLAYPNLSWASSRAAFSFRRFFLSSTEGLTMYLSSW